MTQKEPETAVHLEQAMTENVRNNNSETRLKVYQELLFSDLMLALSDTPDGMDPAVKPRDDTAAAQNDTAAAQNDTASAQGDTHASQLNIAILANPQGTKFAAVFTSAQAIRRWRPQGGQYATMRGQDIFKLLEPSPADVIVVNPGNSPVIVVPKHEIRQLASGIVPKSSTSPVQVPQANQPPSAENQGQQTMQIGFPSNVFNDEQKQRTQEVLYSHTNIIAAAIGAIQPPNAPNKDSWIRTVFLRLQDVEQNQENLKALCQDIRTQIRQDDALFAECQFEVGVMPDNKFWDSLRQNNVLLFEKPLLAHESHATTH